VISTPLAKRVQRCPDSVQCFVVTVVWSVTVVTEIQLTVTNRTT